MAGFDDNYIAQLIAKSYSSGRRGGSSSSSSSAPDRSTLNVQVYYQHRSRSPPAVTVNKQFLLNTISNTESYNRREEISDCWREHDLLGRATNGKRSHVDPGDTDGQDPMSKERDHWARMKALKVADATGPVINEPTFVSVLCKYAANSSEKSNETDEKRTGEKKAKCMKREQENNKKDKKHKRKYKEEKTKTRKEKRKEKRKKKEKAGK